MLSADPALFSAELRPATDEHPPKVGPNLADDEALCKEVAAYINEEFFTPYLLQQERLWPMWERIDDMWRASVNRANLDIGLVQQKKSEDYNKAEGGRGYGTTNLHDYRVAKVSPAAAHKQIDAIINLGVAISFEDGLPVQARKPKTTYENPLYNPIQQSADAANDEIGRQAKEIDLKNLYRVSLGHFTTYGHVFALMDFQRELETIECLHTIPPDAAALAQLRQYYGYPEAKVETDPMGRIVATFHKTVPKVLRTQFTPLDSSAVFIDELLPCTPIERQPCPIIRTHITRWDLEANEYEKSVKPFGWLNLETALKDSAWQYALSQADEGELRQRIAKRWGLIDSISIKPENTIKQLWTAYPMLAIDPVSKKLDKGMGVECSHCKGSGRMSISEPVVEMTEIGSVPTGEMTVREEPCGECAGKGTKRLKSERYVVQMFGTLYGGTGVTVLRIQRNPTAKDRVPLAYRAHLVEDTATARPVSKSEISLSAYEQLATAHNQFLDSKSLTIRRGHLVREGCGAERADIDLNKPNVKVLVDDVDRDVKRMDQSSVDDTTTLIPYMQMEEKEVQDIFGANETVVGEISSGRRAASEITLANEGSKRPLINLIDQHNALIGDWGQFVLDNLEWWMDRDYMQRRTGRATWGKLELFTAVGEELLKRQQIAGNARYVLEATAQDPTMMAVRPQLWEKVFEGLGIDIDISALDQGAKKAQLDANNIVNRILGDGVFLPPTMDDPDLVYVGVFKSAIQEIQTDPANYWHTKQEFLPLLQQRALMQEQILQTKQAMMLQQEMAMQAMMGGPQQGGQGDPRGNQPKSPNQASTPGQAKQNEGKNQ